MPSATEAIGPAFNRMSNICFRPFNIGKWFVMGFCAFLSTCGEGGGGNLNPNNFSGRRGGPGAFPPGTDISRILHDYLGLIILGVIAVLLLGIGITVLVTWLRCRGRFMLLDNVIKNRAAVVEPWNQYRDHAWSYFLFSLLLGLISLVTIIVIGGLGVLIALPDIRAEELTAAGILAIILCVLLLVPIFIALSVIGSYAYDFVVPIMMIRNTSFRYAWREAKANVLQGNLGALVVFYLMKIVLSLGAAVVAMLATCLTCCIAALPYLNSVVLLPVHVFFRTYALSFLEQCHPDYRVIVDYPPPGGFPVEPDSPPPTVG